MSCMFVERVFMSTNGIYYWKWVWTIFYSSLPALRPCTVTPSTSLSLCLCFLTNPSPLQVRLRFQLQLATGNWRLAMPMKPLPQPLPLPLQEWRLIKNRNWHFSFTKMSQIHSGTVANTSDLNSINHWNAPDQHHQWGAAAAAAAAG